MNKKETGVIFNIQRFSVHDGPGIRTTVFMKGCPLKCVWCANPESQDFSPNLMARDILCTGCGACARVCPQSAITLSEKGRRKIDRRKCNDCMRCVDACSFQSLTICGRKMNVDGIMGEVLKDKIFYKNSDGGVTISGGEPLAQSAFALQLLKQCKAGGLHTALDTSGYGKWEDLEVLLPFTDVLLFDIKHLDSAKQKKATAVENEIILENLRKAAPLACLWLRVPLITGFNDSEKHIKEIALLGKEIGAQKISFLPYHEGGKSKNAQLGRRYHASKVKRPSERRIHSLQAAIEKEGLRVTVSN
jgi:glycyl-radical enzyme activating protein